jgi:hypothetical protein
MDLMDFDVSFFTRKRPAPARGRVTQAISGASARKIFGFGEIIMGDP